MAHKHKLPHLLGMSSREIEVLAEKLGQQKFRGRQIAAWVYQRNARSFDEMTDIPADMRSRLDAEVRLYRAEIVTTSTSSDGSSKYLLALEDGERIESVLLPYATRVSVCLSTQVGCAVGCIFCATGNCGFVRNLTAGEIVDQVLTLQRESPRRITHVVYMGMGEPLLNFDEMLKSVRILNSEIGIAARHITISTVGIPSRMHELAREKLQVNLAVSLHAADDETRRKIIPIASRYPIHQVMDACRIYAETTHRRVTFEFLLLKDVNDSEKHAARLASLLKGMLCSVNLIPYNAVPELGLERPDRARIRGFRSVLERAGIAVTQRMERGHAISAACGQLRRRSESPEEKENGADG